MKIGVVVLAGFLAGTFVRMAPPTPTPALEPEWLSANESPRINVPDDPIPLPTNPLLIVSMTAPDPPPLAIPEPRGDVGDDHERRPVEESN